MTSIEEDKKNILSTIRKLLKSNSENYKKEKRISAIYQQNTELANYYNNLLYIYNNEFHKEIDIFNKSQEAQKIIYSSEIDNGEIDVSKPLTFLESKSYKKFRLIQTENTSKSQTTTN